MTDTESVSGCGQNGYIKNLKTYNAEFVFSWVSGETGDEFLFKNARIRMLMNKCAQRIRAVAVDPDNEHVPTGEGNDVFQDWFYHSFPPMIKGLDDLEGKPIGFNSELVYYFGEDSSRVLSNTNREEKICLSIFNETHTGEKKPSKYSGFQSSYSYTEGEYAVSAPRNVFLEYKDESKTRSVTDISFEQVSGDVYDVTLLMSSRHAFGDTGTVFSATVKCGDSIVSGIHDATVISEKEIRFRIEADITPVSGKTTGTVELWNAFPNTMSVNSVSSDDETITFNLDPVLQGDLYGFRVGDELDLVGTEYENALSAEIMVIDGQEVTVRPRSGTFGGTENQPRIHIYPRIPSSAISVNYPRAEIYDYVPDHKLYNKLLPCSKDTAANVWNESFQNYGMTSSYPADDTTPILMSFRIDDSDITSLCDYAALSFYPISISGDDGFGAVYQMSSDSWNETDGRKYSAVSDYIQDMDSSTPYRISTEKNYYYDTSNQQYIDDETSTQTLILLETEQIDGWMSGKRPHALSYSISNDIKQTITSKDNRSVYACQAPCILVHTPILRDIGVPGNLSTTNVKLGAMISSIGGNGGVVTATTREPHGLSVGDKIIITETRYFDGAGFEVKSVVDETTFTYDDEYATNVTEVDRGRFMYSDKAYITMRAEDSVRISQDIDDIVINNFSEEHPISIDEYTFDKSGKFVDFSFWVTEDTKKLSVKSKDYAGNETDEFYPPIIMKYSVNGVDNAMYGNGDAVSVMGINIASTEKNTTFVCADANALSGIIDGGYTQTAETDSDRSRKILLTENSQKEYELVSASGTELELPEDCTWPKVGDAVVFTGKIGTLTCGLPYYIVGTREESGRRFISISSYPGGDPLEVGEITTPKAYIANCFVPVYAVVDGVSSNYYGNVARIKAGTLAPHIFVEDNLVYGEEGAVYVYSYAPVLRQNITIENAVVMQYTPNNCEYMLTLSLDSVGIMYVSVADMCGNSAFSSYAITSLDGSIPLVYLKESSVVGGVDRITFAVNSSAVPDTETRGITCLSDNGQPIGTVGDFVDTEDGFEFTVSIFGTTDGTLNVKYVDANAESSTFDSPIIMDISPDSVKSGDEITIRGYNLVFDNGNVMFSGINGVVLKSSAGSVKILTENVSDGYHRISVYDPSGEKVKRSEAYTLLADSTAPIVSIIGGDVLYLAFGEKYVELGATAVDSMGGDLTDRIVTSGYVVPRRMGEYPITYSVKDDNGNVGIAIRNVVVNNQCGIHISLDKTDVRPGDVVTVTMDTGEFNESMPKNIAYLGTYSMQAIWMEGTKRAGFEIPYGAGSGAFFVSVSNGGCDKSNAIHLNVSYEDTKLDSGDKEAESIFASGIGLPAMYNRDLSYSRFTEHTDENSIIQNVMSIILTKRGERLFNPDFGTRIHEKLFELMGPSSVVEEEVLNMIIKAVNMYEPRAVIIKSESFATFDENAHTINVVLKVVVPGGNARTVGVTLHSYRYEAM